MSDVRLGCEYVKVRVRAISTLHNTAKADNTLHKRQTHTVELNKTAAGAKMGFICSKEISKKHIMEEGVNLLEQYANHIGGFFHSCGLNRLLSTDRNDLWIRDYKGQVFELEN